MLERSAVTPTKTTPKMSRRRFAGSATAAVGVVAASSYVKPEMRALGIPTAYAQVSPTPSMDITVTLGTKTITPETRVTPSVSTTGTTTVTTTITETVTTTETPGTITPTATPS